MKNQFYFGRYNHRILPELDDEKDKPRDKLALLKTNFSLNLFVPTASMTLWISVVCSEQLPFCYAITFRAILPPLFYSCNVDLTSFLVFERSFLDAKRSILNLIFLDFKAIIRFLSPQMFF